MIGAQIGQFVKRKRAEAELRRSEQELRARQEATVKVHRVQVMRKMRAKSLPELVRMADRLAAHGARS